MSCLLLWAGLAPCLRSQDQLSSASSLDPHLLDWLMMSYCLSAWGRRFPSVSFGAPALCLKDPLSGLNYHLLWPARIFLASILSPVPTAPGKPGYSRIMPGSPMPPAFARIVPAPPFPLSSCCELLFLNCTLLRCYYKKQTLETHLL